jgi:hypothetical protein
LPAFGSRTEEGSATRATKHLICHGEYAVSARLAAYVQSA